MGLQSVWATPCLRLTQMPSLIAVVLGIIVGLAAGGRVRALTGIAYRLPGATLALFLAQALLRGRLMPPVVGEELAILGWLAISLMLLVIAFINVRIKGMPLVIAGWMVNLFVVAVNGGMPVMSPIAMDLPNFYHAARSSDFLLWAADVLPMFGFIVSIGDVIALVGVAVALSASMSD